MSNVILQQDSPWGPFTSPYSVNYYVPSAPRAERWQVRSFGTYESALAFFETANLACLFRGQEKLAESIRSEQ